ncbi:NADH-ubiquinone oxidoreductase-F iron-sulfur binding region domain-containing protein [Limnochorda sp.]|uniref:NADH-ubiquinone oxidoreductase-F iron-sulfur binding region domain-containing protein n=1 Tax=Limnochorda sp. TaxID=1940279 RepID=UPI00396F9D2D
METTVGRQAARHQEERSALPQFSVGSGTCGLAAGADKAVALLQRELAARGLEAVVKQVGCVGMCHWEPIVDIRLPGKPRLSFGPCTERNLKRVLHEYVDHGIVPGDLLLGVVVEPGEPTPAPEALEALIQPGPDEPAAPGRLPLLREHPMMRHQVRIVLSNCGLIDPGSLDEYLASGGYQALEKALTQMTPEQVIDEVSTSGLRGRGGAGFPTGKKWALTRQSPGTEKYMVCNADEGDPGAFMDRSILEGDPFRVLEGMTIGAYAVGAQKGFIYVRAEYPLAIQRLQTAIERARAAGYLGERILGTDFSFDIQLKIGAGAFVCGEETALIASIEGKRGMPRPRPPYPAERGVFGKPTNINNVETYANVPDIIRRGGQWFASIGTETSKGTKVFALSGKVRWPGLIEVPMGTPVRTIIEEIGGGVAEGHTFKAVQMGGPSGGCLPEAMLDTPVDYQSLVKAGVIMGSGGLVVMDEANCMVDVAHFFLTFCREESCGQCTPCRVGVDRLCRLLEQMTRRPQTNGTPRSPEEGEALLQQVERLARTVQAASLCGLGQTAPNPVLSTLRYFADEYRAHVLEHRCPAGQCTDLLTFSIVPELCTGCGVCARSCGQHAINGAKGQVHQIDPELCSRCGICRRVCAFGAITAA